jgi:hypothetical protein
MYAAVPVGNLRYRKCIKTGADMAPHVVEQTSNSLWKFCVALIDCVQLALIHGF